MPRRSVLDYIHCISTAAVDIQPTVLDSFLSFLLGFKETSWIFFLLCLAVRSYLPACDDFCFPHWGEDSAGAGQSSCHGVPACTASSEDAAPSNPSHEHFLTFPSPLTGEAGGMC